MSELNQAEDAMVKILQTLLQLSPTSIKQLMKYMSPRIQKCLIGYCESGK